MLRVKRGTILRLQCTHTSGDAAVDLTGVTVTSAARLESSDEGASESHDLDVSVTDAAAGRFTLEADTETWTRGRYAVDVRFDGAGSRYWSETFHVSLAERVTP